MAIKTELEYKQGATWYIPFACELTNEPTPDYTGWKIIFIVKANFAASNADAIIEEIMVPDPSTGEASFTLSDEITAEFTPGEYIYEAVVVDENNEVGKTDTGDFIILESAYKGAIA